MNTTPNPGIPNVVGGLVYRLGRLLQWSGDQLTRANTHPVVVNVVQGVVQPISATLMSRGGGLVVSPPPMATGGLGGVGSRNLTTSASEWVKPTPSGGGLRPNLSCPSGYSLVIVVPGGVATAWSCHLGTGFPTSAPPTGDLYWTVP